MAMLATLAALLFGMAAGLVLGAIWRAHHQKPGLTRYEYDLAVDVLNDWLRRLTEDRDALLEAGFRFSDNSQGRVIDSIISKLK